MLDQSRDGTPVKVWQSEVANTSTDEGREFRHMVVRPRHVRREVRLDLEQLAKVFI
jgi:hypothetical protein